MSKNKKVHQLQEVPEPNLLTDTFSHGLPPFIRFDGPGGHYGWGQLRQSHTLLIKDLARLEKKVEKISAKQAILRYSCGYY